jgi:hypothetical protein
VVIFGEISRLRAFYTKTHMGPFARADRSYVPGLIDEPVPGVAAVVENTLREVIV